MKHKLFINYIYNLLYQIFVIIVPLFTAPYLSRILGATRLGIYSYISSVTAIVSTITLLGIYSYGTRETAYVRDNKRKLSATFIEIMLLRFGMMLIGIIAYSIIAFSSEYKNYFILYFLYFLSAYIDTSWLFIGVEDMRPTVIKNFAIKFLNVIAIFLFVKKADDLSLYVFLLAATTFLSTAVMCTQLKKYICKSYFNISNLKYHIAGSLQLFLPQLASLFYIQMGKIILQWLTGSTAQISFYDQADKLINMPLTFLTVISTVVMPRLANEYKKNNKSSIEKLIITIMKISLLFAVPLMIGIICLAPQLIPWYLGKEFIPTSYALIILSPIIVSNTLSGIFGTQYFTATNQMKIITIAYFSAALVSIILDMFLVPKFGFLGAAISTVVASYISVFIQYAFLKKQINVYGIRKVIFKYCLGAFIMGVVVCFSTKHLTSSFITTFLQIIIGCITYFCVLLILKDEILIYILKYIKRKLKK